MCGHCPSFAPPPAYVPRNSRADPAGTVVDVPRQHNAFLVRRQAYRGSAASGRTSVFASRRGDLERPQWADCVDEVGFWWNLAAPLDWRERAYARQAGCGWVDAGISVASLRKF